MEKKEKYNQFESERQAKENLRKYPNESERSLIEKTDREILIKNFLIILTIITIIRRILWTGFKQIYKVSGLYLFPEP